MSANMKISKKEILDEIEKIHPENYLKLLALLKPLQKVSHKSSSNALEQLFSLQGCLSDIKLNSVELQHKIADIWSEKYEID